jgi:DNA-binding NarL/FixJ family response regulator
MPDCVLLADRHHRFSEGVRGLLETAFCGVFLVADRASLMEGASRLRPDLVVVDVSLAEGDLGDLLQSIRTRAPAAKILLLSVHDEGTVADAAVSAGADGLVLKRAVATDLLPAVEALAGGQHYLSAGIPH